MWISPTGECNLELSVRAHDLVVCPLHKLFPVSSVSGCPLHNFDKFQCGP